MISFLLGLIELLLKYRWKDGRTQKHKIARKWLFVLFILTAVSALMLTMHDKIRAEQESRHLAKALKEAADDRKIHAMAGQLETHKGWPQTFEIGDSGATFVLGRSPSLFDALPIPPTFHKISLQNSVIVGSTSEGKLNISARIRSRDGLVAEINNNEWKVSPTPKTWDRNYSSNALEVQNADEEIVFQIKIKKGNGGLDVAHFQGIFFDSDGNGIGYTVSDISDGAIFSYSPANSGNQLPVIKPLFKYPSELHLGEMVDYK